MTFRTAFAVLAGALTLALAAPASAETPADFAKFNRAIAGKAAAYYATAGGGVAAWQRALTALSASFMNTALTAGDLMTKYMNMIFVVERGNYLQLPALTVWVTIIAFALPVAAVWLWRRHID